MDTMFSCWITVTIAFCSVTLNLPGLVRAECPDAWVPFHGRCYHFGHSELDFQEAEQFCAHYGAHLVDVNTAMENTFLKNYLSDLKYPFFWIGLRDDIVDGIWTWYDTDVATNFTSWATHEPNGGTTENCAATTSAQGHNWFDIACTAKYRPVCEQKTKSPVCAETIIG